jgi:hypothetical protein
VESIVKRETGIAIGLFAKCNSCVMFIYMLADKFLAEFRGNGNVG